ncbi:hypothetical protein SCP_1900810 [Sparassis crispa]|uniref:Uncharacterized protein n=1 Tax=Sparassis crispa TaxID=139825 RepID=A0A401H737_9APHY|nr:hypothetical protein SCP_1900810 [Sparassis crispa]GBE90232.1 hypothetical protein SCP_1900810 [Sparassis crispa]
MVVRSKGRAAKEIHSSVLLFPFSLSMSTDYAGRWRDLVRNALPEWSRASRKTYQDVEPLSYHDPHPLSGTLKRASSDLPHPAARASKRPVINWSAGDSEGLDVVSSVPAVSNQIWNDATKAIASPPEQDMDILHSTGNRVNSSEGDAANVIASPSDTPGVHQHALSQASAVVQWTDSPIQSETRSEVSATSSGNLSEKYTCSNEQVLFPAQPVLSSDVPASLTVVECKEQPVSLLPSTSVTSPSGIISAPPALTELSTFADNDENLIWSINMQLGDSDGSGNSQTEDTEDEDEEGDEEDEDGDEGEEEDEEAENEDEDGDEEEEDEGYEEDEEDQEDEQDEEDEEDEEDEKDGREDPSNDDSDGNNDKVVIIGNNSSDDDEDSNNSDSVGGGGSDDRREFSNSTAEEKESQNDGMAIDEEYDHGYISDEMDLDTAADGVASVAAGSAPQSGTNKRSIFEVNFLESAPPASYPATIPRGYPYLNFCVLSIDSVFYVLENDAFRDLSVGNQGLAQEIAHLRRIPESSSAEDSFSCTQKKYRGKVAHRPGPKLNVQSKIRLHALEMLGRETKRSPILGASDKEVALFERHKHPGPSKEYFRPHFNGTPRTPWNRRLAEVFTNDFISLGWSKRKDFSEIFNMFCTHFETLNKQYKRQTRSAKKPSQAEEDKTAEGHRDQRCRNLRTRRFEAIGQHIDVIRYKDLWNTIPPGAMSGDESDHRSGKLRYVVTKLPWRSAEAERWLCTFDLLHLKTRFHDNGKPKRGAFPHHRIRGSSRIERNDDPVSGLPRNFYDATWLSDQSEDHIRALDIQPSVDLTLSQDCLREAARFARITNRRTPPRPRD